MTHYHILTIANATGQKLPSSDKNGFQILGPTSYVMTYILVPGYKTVSLCVKFTTNNIATFIWINYCISFVTLYIVFESIYPYNAKGPSWSWSYGSWIYNYLWNQCLSSLTLSVRIPLRRGVLDTLCNTIFSELQQVGDFLLVLRFSPTVKLTTILLKVALNTFWMKNLK